MGKPNEVKALRAALKSANQMCLSMASIAERHGRVPGTNWDAFRDRLRESLAMQHAVLHPELVAPAPADTPRTTQVEGLSGGPEALD